MTTLQQIDLQCPICENRFRSQAVVSTNSFGGKRTDFHERAATLGEEPPVGRRVLGITDGGADLPPRETRPLGGGGDQIARRLAAEGNVAAQVGHEIFGHDQDGAHR